MEHDLVYSCAVKLHEHMADILSPSFLFHVGAGVDELIFFAKSHPNDLPETFEGLPVRFHQISGPAKPL